MTTLGSYHASKVVNFSFANLPVLYIKNHYALNLNMKQHHSKITGSLVKISPTKFFHSTKNCVPTYLKVEIQRVSLSS